MMMTAIERLDQYCRRFGVTFSRKVKPEIRADGVLCLKGKFDTYPVDENSRTLALRAQKIIVERETCKGRFNP